jgi:uncharacterized protein (TIGR02444 family)
MAKMRQSKRGGRMADTGEAFWRFSLALYARPGAAPALIALQDRSGRDVNLMLFALWVGAVRGFRLAAADLAAAEAASIDLRRPIVEPLRGLRRQLKDDPDPDLQEMRRRVLMLELGAERRVQQRLAASLPADASPVQPDTRLVAAEANLALYLGAEDRSAEADLVRAALAALTRWD